MEAPETETTATKRLVWNAERSVGAKRALKPKQIWLKVGGNSIVTWNVRR